MDDAQTWSFEDDRRTMDTLRQCLEEVGAGAGEEWVVDPCVFDGDEDKDKDKDEDEEASRPRPRRKKKRTRTETPPAVEVELETVQHFLGGAAGEETETEVNFDSSVFDLSGTDPVLSQLGLTAPIDFETELLLMQEGNLAALRQLFGANEKIEGFVRAAAFLEHVVRAAYLVLRQQAFAAAWSDIDCWNCLENINDYAVRLVMCAVRGATPTTTTTSLDTESLASEFTEKTLRSEICRGSTLRADDPELEEASRHMQAQIETHQHARLSRLREAFPDEALESYGSDFLESLLYV